MAGNYLQYMYCAQWINAIHSLDWEYSGVLACGDGKEEKNATQMQRHGMVDEEETVAVSTETESETF